MWRLAPPEPLTDAKCRPRLNDLEMSNTINTPIRRIGFRDQAARFGSVLVAESPRKAEASPSAVRRRSGMAGPQSSLLFPSQQPAEMSCRNEPMDTLRQPFIFVVTFVSRMNLATVPFQCSVRFLDLHIGVVQGSKLKRRSFNFLALNSNPVGDEPIAASGERIAGGAVAETVGFGV